MRATPFTRFRAVWFFGLGSMGLLLSHCSLSLENPEEAARKKLQQVIPTTLTSLEGRWIVDSTYTVYDTKATSLRDASIKLEVFPDSTLFAYDSLKINFLGKISARFVLSGDTLFIKASAGPNPVQADTFLVKLRFLGNYLELDHPLDQRFTFFHKQKFLDSTIQDSILGDSLWLLKSRRLNQDSLWREPLIRDFTYLRIKPNLLWRDWHRNGIFRTDSGSLVRKGRKWTWQSPNGSREFLVDLITQDTLRMWPLVAGKPDSGFDTYTKTIVPHPFDLDMRPLFGHLRTDSIKDPASWLVNHFGRFYDWEITQDHVVLTQTNMAGLPLFQSWSLDSGQLLLKGVGGVEGRIKVDTTLPKILKMVTMPSSAFPVALQFYQSKVNADRFAEHPLERFDQASYAHIIIGSDTLRYYFSANFIKVTPEEFEIQHQDSQDSSWLTLRLNPGQESFPSSQSGFRYLMEGRTTTLGKFTCQAMATNTLVIRLSNSIDPTSATGLIQGDCHILSSTIAPVDSNLVLDGIFRFKRKTIAGHQSNLWLR